MPPKDKIRRKEWAAAENKTAISIRRTVSYLISTKILTLLMRKLRLVDVNQDRIARK